MSFQDELLRNMRTKDEAETAHNEEMMQIAAQHAQYSIAKIKNALLTASNNGEYEIIDGKKTAVCYVSFPEHCQHFLTLKDESEYTPATPSNFELHLRELTQAAPSERKAILKKYKGVNLSAGGSPAHYRKCIRFNVDASLNHECGCYIHMLSQYCNDENITFDIAVFDTYKGDFHPLHTPIYNSSTYVFDYRIYAKCSCLIPDKYSSDIPFNVDESIIGDDEKPSMFNLALEATENNTVNIKWNAIHNAKKYQILRLDSQSRKIIGETGLSSPAFTDNQIIIGEDYTYQIVCTTANDKKMFSERKSIRVGIAPHNEKEEFQNQQPTGISIDYMDGHQFEKFCGELLRKNGYYDVDVTRGSGDQGIDIIAFKDGIKFGIQCKCYASDIGNKAVQEAFSGKTYYNCHVGVVLTNRYFTRSAIDLAKKNGVLLWDRGHLLDMVKKAGVIVDEE